VVGIKADHAELRKIRIADELQSGESMRRTVAVLFCVLVARAGGVFGAPPSQVEPAEALGLSRRMTLSGGWEAAIALLRKEIARASSASSQRSEAALRVELGRVLADKNFFRRTDPDASHKALEDALRFSRQIGDARSEADAVQYLGQLEYSKAFATRNWQAPRGRFLEVIEARERLGDLRGLAESHFYLGLTYEQDGQPELAMQNYRKSLSLS